MDAGILVNIQECFVLITQEVDKYLALQNLSDIALEYKTDICGCREEVTRIDKEIEEICKYHLFSRFPDFGVVAEESSGKEEAACESNCFFAVDPVDGTLELLDGGSNWSVSLAAIADGKTQVAMLYFPRKSIRLSAIRGQGAWLNGVRVASKSSDRRICKIGVSPRQIAYPVFRETLTALGCQYAEIPHFTPKILALVLGEIDAAAYLPQKNKGVRLWDYAAASLVLHEFGGKLGSLTEEPLDFNGHVIMHHQGGWIAAYSNLGHAPLVNALLSVNLDK